MKKSLLLITSLVCIILLSSCMEKETQAPTTSVKEPIDHQNEENTQIDQSNETLTKEDAIKKVKEYLSIEEDDQNIVVEFDHERDGNFIIHVYNIITEGEENSHTATIGWYTVNPTTGEVESLF